MFIEDELGVEEVADAMRQNYRSSSATGTRYLFKAIGTNIRRGHNKVGTILLVQTPTAAACFLAATE